MDLVRKRRSIRRYKSDPIPEQYLKTILEAARLTPSSGNRQCWRYIIVTDQDIKKRLAEAEGKWTSEAPVIIVACADPKALRPAKSQGLQYKVIGKMGQLYKTGRRLSEKLRNQLVS